MKRPDTPRFLFLLATVLTATFALSACEFGGPRGKVVEVVQKLSVEVKPDTVPAGSTAVFRTIYSPTLPEGDRALRFLWEEIAPNSRGIFDTTMVEEYSATDSLLYHWRAPSPSESEVPPDSSTYVQSFAVNVGGGGNGGPTSTNPVSRFFEVVVSQDD